LSQVAPDDLWIASHLAQPSLAKATSKALES
jgi:hypothetical protein